MSIGEKLVTYAPGQTQVRWQPILRLAIYWSIAYILFQLIPSWPLTYRLSGAAYGAFLVALIFALVRTGLIFFLVSVTNAVTRDENVRSYSARSTKRLADSDFKRVVMMGAIVGLVWGWWTAPLRCVPSQILTDRIAFDEKKVEVIGTLGSYAPRVSRRGNEYTLASVCDQGGCVRVYARGWHPTLIPTQPIDVVGTYRVEDRVGYYRFFNEIEASALRRPPLVRQIIIGLKGGSF